jgi:amino acid transporter
MYLRLGWLLGHVGIVNMIAVILLASAITLITGLSISAIATNMKVGSGGAYFMISRSLGIEIGSAIGIPLFLAQAIGIAFYIEGFSETIRVFYPWLDLHAVELCTLLAVTSLGYFSTSWALKAQFYIFILIILSLISIFWGGELTSLSDIDFIPPEKISFWIAFSIFFPAVTGIEAGFSMSGDLQNPRRSLPLGTLSAVLIGGIVYILLTIFLWNTVPNNILRTDAMIVQNIAKIGILVTLGIWGATLSSAIGGILGGPRTLQALANDGILPKFIGKGCGKTNEPRAATFITFLIAALTSYFGNINLIAPILTMFFLISYGMLNLASGLEGMLGNPGWRPTFHTSWTLSCASSPCS